MIMLCTYLTVLPTPVNMSGCGPPRPGIEPAAGACGVLSCNSSFADDSPSSRVSAPSLRHKPDLDQEQPNKEI